MRFERYLTWIIPFGRSLGEISTLFDVDQPFWESLGEIPTLFDVDSSSSSFSSSSSHPANVGRIFY